MKKSKLGVAIGAAFIVSIVIGAILQNNEGIAAYFSPLGTIYINLIKMTMVPMVVTSLILGMSSIVDVKKLGKMGVMTVCIFLGTTAFAVVIGLILSNIFKPGLGVSVGGATYEAKEMPSLLNQLVGIFPDNMLSSLVSANMLQVIVISLIIGVAIVQVGEKGRVFRDLIESLFEIMVWITKKVMLLTPIGVMGLMIPTVAKNGLDVLLPLGKLILILYLAVVIQIVVVYFGGLKLFTSHSVKEFLRAMMPAQIIAFVTCSSAAALPALMQRAQDELKVSKEASGFVIPLGNTINMDGNALYQGIVSLFVAQAYGIELGIATQIMIVLTGTLASIGAAGVPGAGMVVLSTVLATAGLPVDGIALVAGIDRILDMGRTLTNVTGDVVTACIVDKWIGKKDGVR